MTNILYSKNKVFHIFMFVLKFSMIFMPNKQQFEQNIVGGKQLQTSFTNKQIWFQPRFVNIEFLLLKKPVMTKARPRLFINQSAK